MAKKGRRKAPQKKSQKKTQKRGKRRRPTAACSNARREVMNRPIALSEELAEVVGARALSRPEAVKRLWAYCRKNGLLNPKDKRQILCDNRLQKLLGKKTATLFGLHGLLAPHFNFSGEVNEAMADNDAEEAEDNDEDEQEEEEEEEEATLSSDPLAYQRDKFPPSLDAIAETLVLRVLHLEREMVTLNFTAISRQCRFEALAIPVSKAGSSTVIRGPCSVQIVRDAKGDVEVCGEAHIKGLSPMCSYRLAVEVGSLDARNSAHILSPVEVQIPQREHPEKWSAVEAQLWCQSIQVPALAQKVKEYGVDGNTLLCFTEDDLRGIGISTPFILRRVLSALKSLGGG